MSVCLFHFHLNTSPTISGKKSFEIIQGGISSIKNAATSVAKKLDEIKGAMSPDMKSSERSEHRNHSVDLDIGGHSTYGARKLFGGEQDLWGHLSDSRTSSYNNLIFLGEHQAKNFPNSAHSKLSQISLEHIGSDGFIDIELQMSTSSTNHNCTNLMSDRDIMAGWSADDSNLNTFCDVCKKFTVPFLSVDITTYKSQNNRSKHTSQLSVPYLNPLVLRKELENALMHFGDDVLCKLDFVDEHPIIYWNLLWFMERIGVQTHLSQLFYTKTVSVLSDERPFTSEWKLCCAILESNYPSTAPAKEVVGAFYSNLNTQVKTNG